MKISANGTYFKHMLSLFVALLSTVGLLLVEGLINKKVNFKEETKRVVQIHVDRKVEKKVIKRQKPRPKKQKLTAPNLSNMISGLSFGIPGYQVDLDNLNNVSGNLDNRVIDSSKLDVSPKILFKPKIKFPISASRKNIEGYVVLLLLIDEKGRVESTKVLESAPKGVFDQSALSNVTQWKFSPGLYKGSAVASWQRQKLTYQMN